MKNKLCFIYVIVNTYLQLNATIKLPTELPFVISVSAYNNEPWVKKNLDSIFMQDYSNFRVVYIDDGSSDNTAMLVQQYIDLHNLHEKLTLQVNTKRCKKMKNIYNLFHTCDDNEIIVQVDGDDWLAHDQVFSILNRTYQEKQVWLTYGQFKGHDGSQADICTPVPANVIANRSFRTWPRWVYTHLRTFYAWLFKNIKLEDVINEQVPGYQGKFFPLGNDAATYFPMLEMCGDKFAFIPDILYIYNRENPFLTAKLTNHLIKPASQDIRSRPQYPQINEPKLNRLAQYKTARADVIILSDNNLEQINNFINSLLQHATGFKDIYIIYNPPKKEGVSFKSLEQLYDNVHCISLTYNKINHILNDILRESKQEHFIITNGSVELIDALDIPTCITELERTFAYAFYLNFAQSEPFIDKKTKKELIPHEHITNDLYAWKFKCENNKNYLCDKYLYNSIDMVLFRKKTLLQRVDSIFNQMLAAAKGISKIIKHTPKRLNITSDFIAAWYKFKDIDLHKVGLFFGREKCTSYMSK
ncbi:MAG: glycosyltransferase family 2 protein [Candidatus Babeliales bacterium]